MDICIHDLRKFSTDKHKKVALRQAQGNPELRRRIDDRPYGGGPGMVLKIEPLSRALESILKTKNTKTKVVLFSVGGKQFDAKMATDWAQKYKQIVMVAGHYEGVDERLEKIVFENWKLKIENLSIGPYVLTGGELPAMVVIDSVSRHIPGFLGKAESLEENRYGAGLPCYTRPEVFAYKGKKYKVPPVLLSGDHKKIGEWKTKNQNTSGR